MPNHLIAMFLIRRLIELRQQGHSQRAIARHLSLARKTVDKYVRELKSHFPDLRVLDLTFSTLPLEQSTLSWFANSVCTA